MDTSMESTTVVRLQGTIVKRRSMGRNLAFVEVLSRNSSKDEDSSSSSSSTFDNDEIVSVAFRRNSFLGTNFPVKNSQFPYAAPVDMSVKKSLKSSGPRWEVLSWKVVSENQAKELATSADGGICCSKYLQIRSETYREQLAAYTTSKPLDPRKAPPETESHTDSAAAAATSTTKDHSQAKSLRSKIFASWLLENLLNNKTEGDRVLDVAGGKGELSMQLAHMGSVACSVVDPVVRKRPKMKQLRKLSKPVPEFRPLFFQAQDASTLEVVESHSCLVGLHPDEPTEDIVDLAIRYNKSFAVVPCCVFPSFNLHRRLETGEFVQTYEQFLEYLMQKDSRIKRATLPLEGKNQVIFLKVISTTQTSNPNARLTP
jgi:hypothetical protein